MTLNTRPQPRNQLEIERKFLVAAADLPGQLSKFPHQPIRQGYVVYDGNTGVRLRIKGDVCYITVKSGQGLARQEYEGEIPRETFDILWPTTDGKRIEKVRYEIAGPDELLFELDIFEGALRGLITVEVEFDSLDAARRFDPPAWFGRDVTTDPRYNNSNLATSGLPAG